MYRSPIPWRRHIFVDCGGNNGSSVRKFRADYDRHHRFKIYTFEPNPAYQNRYSDFPNHILIPAAVSNSDGTAEFFLDREDGDGSTLFRSKLTRENGGYGTLDTANPDLVKTVDLSRWIQEELRPSDYILLKLDVEGAEYDILEKMARDKTLRRIKHLFVEWHWWKVGIAEERHKEAMRLLSSAKIPVTEWDAAGR